MRISIITVVYNNRDTIREAIHSVLGQDYPDIEYIIVDGGSSDGTVDIIKSYDHRVHKFISEPDKGIYDAMNKGIAMAGGDYIGILNSDDVYQDENVITRVMQTFREEKVNSVYGNLVYVTADDPRRIIRYWEAGQYRKDIFLQGWMPPHPTFFVRKSVYDQYGSFNLDMGSAADYELMLRFLHRHRISTTYINKVLVRMRTGGQSNASLRQRLLANFNDRRAWKVAGLKPRFYTLWLKPVRKIPQYMKSAEFEVETLNTFYQRDES